MKSWSKWLLLFAVSSAWTVQAQSPDSIVLNVTVTTKKGVLTRGLKMENFSVTADQQALKVLSLSEVRDSLKASDVVLYCIGISNDLYLDDRVFRNREGFTKLDELSSATGGRGLFTTNAAGPRAFNEVFELIALELRNHYQLVIAPDHSGSKAKWRKLKIDAQRGSEELLARTRRWYFK